MGNEAIEELIAEAKRQNRYMPSIAARLVALAKYQPLRALWCARTAWLLFTRWNAPQGHEARATLWQEWSYARGLAEMLDDYGPMFPTEAIDSDRQYWEG